MIKRVVAVIVIVLLLGTWIVPAVGAFQDNTGRNLEVLIVAGQSNAAYDETQTERVNVDVANEYLGTPENNVYYFGTDTSPAFRNNSSTAEYDGSGYAMHSMRSGDSWKIGLHDAALAYYLSEKTHNDVYVINCGVSGSTIGNLLPEGRHGAYVDDLISDALSRIDTSKYNVQKIGWVFLQGEGNQYSGIQYYLDAFRELREYFMDEGFDTCYLVQTRPENGRDSAPAQLMICEMYSNVILASTAPATFTEENGLLSSDGLHYTALGRLKVDEDVAEHFEATYYAGRDAVAQMVSILPVIMLISLILIMATFIIRRDD